MPDYPDDVEILKRRLSEDPSEEFLDRISSAVVDKIEESFPELSLDSQPIADALHEFRETKIKRVDSKSQYNTKIDYIEKYFEEVVDKETTEELSSEDIERYRQWRKYESLERDKPLSDNTLQDDMYIFRDFVRYLIGHRLVPKRFREYVEIPNIDHNAGEGVDEKRLDPEIAKSALEYLRKYHYADVEHITMELCCQSGPRESGLGALDVKNFCYEERVIFYKHQEKTPLKNNEQSEREVDLYGELPEIIQDYIENTRPESVDEEGRQPLLTKGDGRISLSMIQKIAYMWTRPCAIGLGCPHDRDPEECEAAQRNNSAYKCPSSRAPHHIRTGYITDQKNRGVSSDAINQRCDVTPRVQNQHYDLPDPTEERKRYRDEFRDADDDPESGYSH